jgi:hypothetical protein
MRKEPQKHSQRSGQGRARSDPRALVNSIESPKSVLLRPVARAFYSFV